MVLDSVPNRQVTMATTSRDQPELDGSSNAQPPSTSPTKARAASFDQLAVPTSNNIKRVKSEAIKNLIVEKVRGVGHRFNKLGKHLSTSDQSDLAAASPRLLSVSSLDPESDEPRLVRTNAFKVSISHCPLEYCICTKYPAK